MSRSTSIAVCRAQAKVGHSVVREVQWLQTRRVSNVTIRAVSKLAKLGFRVEGFQNNELQMNLSELLSGLATEETINECARQGFRTLEEECGPLIGAGLEAWTDQQLAATFTRDFLDYSTERDARVDTNLLDSTARAWSARWEDRTKAGAFMAAMGPIREEISRQIADEELRLDTPREYRSDSDEQDY